MFSHYYTRTAARVGGYAFLLVPRGAPRGRSRASGGRGSSPRIQRAVCGRPGGQKRMALSSVRLSWDYYAKQKGFRSATTRKSALIKPNSGQALALLRQVMLMQPLQGCRSYCGHDPG